MPGHHSNRLRNQAIIISANNRKGIYRRSHHLPSRYGRTHRATTYYILDVSRRIRSISAGHTRIADSQVVGDGASRRRADTPQTPTAAMRIMCRFSNPPPGLPVSICRPDNAPHFGPTETPRLTAWPAILQADACHTFGMLMSILKIVAKCNKLPGLIDFAASKR